MNNIPLAPIYSLDEICYDYNDKISALDHISLTVNAGEKVAILGSNGSGKSTLLKILDGLYFSTSGTICAFGKAITEDNFRDDETNFAFRSQVGFVFQDSDVQLFMPTVWDEIAFAPLQMGISHQEVITRVDSAMQALQIEKLRDRAPHQLSGGEKKRVALASVLTLTPQVWLLDEPTAGLDPRSVAWLIDFINAQGQAGKTVILATHDLDIVAATADRIYVLDESHRLTAQGTPAEILADKSLLVRTNLAR